MAKARKVIGDQNSEEVDQLRRTVHTLMLMLENLGTMLTTLDNTSAATIVTGMTEIGTGLNAALDNGLDADIGGTLYVGATGLEIAGMRPSPQHPRRPRTTQNARGTVVDLDPTDL